MGDQCFVEQIAWPSAHNSGTCRREPDYCGEESRTVRCGGLDPGACWYSGKRAGQLNSQIGCTPSIYGEEWGILGGHHGGAEVRH